MHGVPRSDDLRIGNVTVDRSFYMEHHGNCSKLRTDFFRIHLPLPTAHMGVDPFHALIPPSVPLWLFRHPPAAAHKQHISLRSVDVRTAIVNKGRAVGRGRGELTRE